jgi:hypothetical protein
LWDAQVQTHSRFPIPEIVPVGSKTKLSAQAYVIFVEIPDIHPVAVFMTEYRYSPSYSLDVRVIVPGSWNEASGAASTHYMPAVVPVIHFTRLKKNSGYSLLQILLQKLLFGKSRSNSPNFALKTDF